MEFFQISDIGKVRATNEDSVGSISSKDGKVRFFIVADGMGGHLAGEVASRMATELFLQEAAGYSYKGVEELRDFLPEAVGRIDGAIAKKAQTSSSCSDMGTTAVIYAAAGDCGLFCNVGDSRGYLIRDGKLIQVTKDHSLIQSMVDRGYVFESEENKVPFRHAITRALGCMGDAKEGEVCDIFEIVPQKGDAVLLCSDGLTSMLSDEEILPVVSRDNLSAEDVCRKLVEEANLRGGFDNITVSVIRYRGE